MISFLSSSQRCLDKCSVTKHTPARVWGDILWGFFAHKVSICLLEITLIQWNDLPCTSLQKLTRPQCLWYQNVKQFVGTKRILISQNTQNKTQTFLTSIRPSAFHSTSFSEEYWKQRMPVFWSSIFITIPPKFSLGFQSKLKCSLKAGHTCVMLRVLPYPRTLSSNELIILSLDAGSASHIEILGLKVGIIQLLRSLRKKDPVRVKLQITWLWKSTRILFFKQREWKSVEVKIISCFQRKGKYRDCIQLWTRVILRAWLLLLNTIGIPKITQQ